MRSVSLLVIALCATIEAGVAAEPAIMAYRVTDSGDSLTMVSLRLYGTHRRWAELAALNQISSPYHIRLGRVLNLPAPATLSQKEGDAIVLNYWRRKFGSDEESQVADVNGAKSSPAKVIRMSDAEAKAAKEADAKPSVKETVVDLKNTTEDRITGAERPEYQPTFIAPGKVLLEEHQFDEAFDHFSKLAFVPRHEIPDDDHVIYLEGDQAQRVFDALPAAGRAPAAATNIENRDPTTLHFSDFERKTGKDISCARVPLLDQNGKYVKDRRTRRIIFTARCVGYRK